MARLRVMRTLQPQYVHSDRQNGMCTYTAAPGEVRELRT